MSVIVQLISEGEQIGSVELTDLDPPMGCALGPLTPTAYYDPQRHASYLGGDWVGDARSPITVALIDGTPVECVGVCIFDGQPHLDEIEADILGMEQEVYEALFVNHSHYLEYYRG